MARPAPSGAATGARRGPGAASSLRALDGDWGQHWVRGGRLWQGLRCLGWPNSQPDRPSRWVFGIAAPAATAGAGRRWRERRWRRGKPYVGWRQGWRRRGTRAAMFSGPKLCSQLPEQLPGRVCSTAGHVCWQGAGWAPGNAAVRRPLAGWDNSAVRHGFSLAKG
jgi:hypothetical protein